MKENKYYLILDMQHKKNKLIEPDRILSGRVFRMFLKLFLRNSIKRLFSKNIHLIFIIFNFLKKVSKKFGKTAFSFVIVVEGEIYDSKGVRS